MASYLEILDIAQQNASGRHLNKAATPIPEADPDKTMGQSFLEGFVATKGAVDGFQAALAGFLPSIPGMPAGKFMDLAIGIDFEPTILPPSPLMAVPHVGMVFDMVACIFAAINTVMTPPPPGPSSGDGKVAISSICQAIVGSMVPSVQVNNQWIANAGVPIQHMPGVFLHAAPLTKPTASSEMFMGSATVLADGSPFCMQYMPALSCNLVGIPAPPRPKSKPKMTLMAPTSVLLTVIPKGLPVLVGGPPTIDLFALALKLGIKGVGKIAKKGASKFKDLVKKNKPKLAKALQPIKCRLFGEPVDAATGRVFAANEDFALPGPIPLVWERTYYSDAEVKTSLGYNCHHSYNMGLVNVGNGFAVRLQDGREIGVPFLPEVGEFYHPIEKMTWQKTAAGYRLKDANGLYYTFHDFANAEGLQPLAKIENDRQNRILFEYELGELSRIIDSANRTIYVDTKDGFIKEVYTNIDGLKHFFVRYDHDELGNLSYVENQNDSRKYFEYKGHLMTKLTNQMGISFYWEYEGEGDDAKCIHTWGDEGILEYWTRYEDGRTITTDSLGHTTEYYYDADNLIYKIVDAKGGVSYQEYDDLQNLMVEIGPDGNVRKHVYDSHSNLVSTTDENGNTSNFQYNADNRLISAKSAEGNYLELSYTENGQLYQQKDASGSEETFSYDERGQLAAITDHQGRSTEFKWDSSFQLVKAILPNLAQVNWQYNALGQLTEQTMPNGGKTSYQYDAAGNVVQIAQPDGNVHYFSYDAAGNVLSAKDRNRSVSFTYWGLGHLKTRTENGTTVTFKYDTEERLKSITNEHHEVYRFTRDPLGDVIGEWGFDGLHKRYQRDEVGRVSKVFRPDNRWTSYQYEPNGNLIAAEYSDDSFAYFKYLHKNKYTLYLLI